MCIKSEAFEIIRLALQGGIVGLPMHSKSKMFLLHQKSCTGDNQLYNICKIALTSWKHHPHRAWNIELICRWYNRWVNDSLTPINQPCSKSQFKSDCLISEDLEEIYEICVFCPDTVFEWKKNKCPGKPGYMVTWCRSYCLCKRGRDKGWLAEHSLL